MTQQNVDISRWAYYDCLYIKDRKESYEQITTSEWAFYYCKNIKNRASVRSKITDPAWAHQFCLYKYDKHVAEYTKNTDYQISTSWLRSRRIQRHGIL